MDAQGLNRCLKLMLFVAVLASGRTFGDTYQTVNFTVTAASQDVAREVGEAAEMYRRQLAIFWLGKPLPNWSRPCKLTVKVGPFGAGGQTTFQFVRGEVLNWRMQVQGSLERILDSVLPHEVNHTIFACHFRRPLPRWADEGAATLFEHVSEQRKQLDLLNEVMRNQKELIPLRELLSMKEYPKGQRAMLTMYAQGFALADFLVQQKGRQAYLDFIGKGELIGWDKALQAHFDHEDIQNLEKNWKGWVLAGMPKLTLPREQMLASESDSVAQEAARPQLPPATPASAPPRRRSQPGREDVVRSQSPNGSADSHSVTQTQSGGAARGRQHVRPAATTNRDTKASEPVINVAEPPVERDFRHSSIAAPAPRVPDDASQQRGNEADVDDRRQASAESTSPAAVLLNRSNGSGPVEQEQEKTLRNRPLPNDPATKKELIRSRVSAITPARQELERTNHFEATGMHQEKSAATRQEISGFEFGSVLLPRERAESPGHTPQWAGFPGQKKLF